MRGKQRQLIFGLWSFLCFPLTTLRSCQRYALRVDLLDLEPSAAVVICSADSIRPWLGSNMVKGTIQRREFPETGGLKGVSFQAIDIYCIIYIYIYYI